MLVMALVGLPFFVLAQEVSSAVNAFKRIKEVSVPSLSVPAVVQVPFENESLEQLQFAILNVNTNTFEPYYVKQKQNIALTALSGSVLPNEALRMVDDNYATYAEFLVLSDNQGMAVINITSNNPITTTALSLSLDRYVALPNTIEIKANVFGQDRIIVAQKKLTTTTVQFPETTSKEWTVTFRYGQPLRITELDFNIGAGSIKNSIYIRFLAHPESQYKIYFNPDRSVVVPTKESGNLNNDVGVIMLSPVTSKLNPEYIQADVDDDGIPDILDNCVQVFNKDQIDIDNNGRGDVCDDFDRDGVINSTDNCPEYPNKNQSDEDGDKIGDVCDEEESRFTERYGWIPWAGIGLAGLVLVILFAKTAWSISVVKKTKNIGEPDFEIEKKN